MNGTISRGSLQAFLQNIFALAKTSKAVSDMAKLCSNLERSISIYQHNSG